MIQHANARTVKKWWSIICYDAKNLTDKEIDYEEKWEYRRNENRKTARRSEINTTHNQIHRRN